MKNHDKQYADICKRLEEYKASFKLKGYEPIEKYYNFKIGVGKQDYVIMEVNQETIHLPYKLFVVPHFIGKITVRNGVIVSGDTERLVFEGDIRLGNGAFYQFPNLKKVVFKGNAILDTDCFCESTIDEVIFEGYKVKLANYTFTDVNDTYFKFSSREVVLENSSLAVGDTLDFSEADLKTFIIDPEVLELEGEFNVIMSEKNRGIILDAFGSDTYSIKHIDKMHISVKQNYIFND